MDLQKLDKAGDISYLAAGSAGTGVLLVSLSTRNTSTNVFAGSAVTTTGLLMMALGLSLGLWSAYLVIKGYLSSSGE